MAQDMDHMEADDLLVVAIETATDIWEKMTVREAATRYTIDEACLMRWLENDGEYDHGEWLFIGIAEEDTDEEIQAGVDARCGRA